VPFLTINTVGPTLMEYGTDAQRTEFLPKILKGEMHFSIGYSEPGAGTDLASLSTRAVRDGDEYVINGQKMWTSLIQYADYVWLAARTDPEAKKHKGLSMFLLKTDSPGFSWTPVATVSGTTTSATFYSDVRVPAENLVGGENNGWKLITNQLNHERVALCAQVAGIVAKALEMTAAYTKERVQFDRPIATFQAVGQRAADAYIDVEATRLVLWQAAWRLSEGLPASTEVEVAKYWAAEAAHRVGHTAVHLHGGTGVDVDHPIHRYFIAAKELEFTLGGATDQLLRIGASLAATRG
jgi:alkylation response protein AidB-like acyl-CoA dehydrogenase